MKRTLLLATLGLVSACTRHSVSEQARLQLLDITLQQANRRASEANDKEEYDLHRQASRFGDVVQSQVVARILVQSDSIIARSHQLGEAIEAARAQVRSVHSDVGLRKLLLGEQRDGVAYQLLARLLAYRANLRRADATVWLPNLLPPKVVADTSLVGLVNLYFSDATATQAAASLTQLQAEVLAAAAAALRAQSVRIACGGNIIYDQYGAYASAMANTVRAGEVYRAGLFLAMSVRPSQPVRMTLNGEPLPVDAYGRGEVCFIADTAKLGRQQRVTDYWVGTIQTTYLDRDTTFKVRVPYTITR